MTLTDRGIADPAVSPNPPVDRPGRSQRLIGAGVGVSVLVIVAILAQIPLIKNHIFYYWDDSAAAFLPDWYQMGSQLRGGHWPVLDPGMWMGGNFAAEAMMGVFNPVSLANFVVVSLLPDLAVAATLVKTEFLVLLALGVYLLAREYRANRAAAAVIATAVPFAGYTLYFDAQAWVGGLMAFAWLPLVWWSVRRFARGVTNPIVPFIFGYLAMSTGNPYGALGVVVVLLAVGVEQLVQRHWRRFAGLVLVGVLIGISTLVVFLPLLGSSSVTWRNAVGVTNDGFMVPNLGDLFGMSAPTYQPQFKTFGPPPTFPAFYLAWFVLPLAPWLSWASLRERARERFGIAVFGGIYLLLLVGPSNLWLFRWPARLTEYAMLPIALAVALVLSKGFRTTFPLRRALASGAIIMGGAYLSWSSTPVYAHWHELATMVVAGFVAGVLLAVFRRPKFVAPIMVVGTGAVLALQVIAFPGNANITPWHFPHDIAAMRANYGARYQGNTLQIADTGVLAASNVPLTPDGAWRDLALASAMHAGGVDSLNDYTGIGDIPFSDALCMTYYGGTCADAYARLWRPVPGTNANLADVLNLRTVVVLNGYMDNGPRQPSLSPLVPAGWSVQQRTALVTVLRRDAAPIFPRGRLSWAAGAPGVIVQSDQGTGPTGERTVYSGTGGRMLFAMLAWPGWHATVDGHDLPIRQGPAGIIQLDLPPATNGRVELSFTPPGVALAPPLIGLGLFGALVYGAFWEIRRRRATVVIPDGGDTG